MFHARINASFTIALLFSLSVPGWTQDENAPGHLTVLDILSLKSVADPQFSPKGDWVAYTVQSLDFEADETSTRIHIV
jgi:hypothetical protein